MRRLRATTSCRCWPAGTGASAARCAGSCRTASAFWSRGERRQEHMRPRQLGTQAGIIEMEAPIHWSNVALVCPDCDRPTRVGFRLRPDDVKVRYCKRCEEELD